MLNKRYHIKRLSYEIAIFNNPRMTGNPLASVTANDPGRTIFLL